MRVRATSDNPAEPIFRLTGGLGQSNMVGFSLVPWFIEDHDIVLVGYRGVDGPVVLACPEVVKAIKTDSGDWLSELALESINAAYASCAARLQGEGVDTDGYTVAEVVDDLEAARIGLGYDRINLLSESELEVLHLMATGLKYQEITGKLVVSVNKVHHHTRNIYGKLDVNSRALIHKKVKFVEKTPKSLAFFLGN